MLLTNPQTNKRYAAKNITSLVEVQIKVDFPEELKQNILGCKSYYNT